MNDNVDRPAEDRRDCDYRTGALPACGRLALAYVPGQEEAAPRYEPPQAMARGTLFPGLDLPWKNVVNRTPEDMTPLEELMALGFVVQELGLYLDTHAEDREALALFTRYAALYKEGEARYTARCGPLTQRQTTEKGYAWAAAPWPWAAGEGGNG